MTAFAVCFFFLVVIFELYLVVWMPIQLKREGVLQKHVAKENLINLADSLRSDIRRIKTKDSLAEGEVQLAVRVLDLYALYIREQQDNLDLPQILELYRMLNRYQACVENWRSGKFIFRKETIDLPAAFHFIEKKNRL